MSKLLSKMLSNFIEITLWHGCSPVNLLHIFRTNFPKNISRWLLLKVITFEFYFTNLLESLEEKLGFLGVMGWLVGLFCFHF